MSPFQSESANRKSTKVLSAAACTMNYNVYTCRYRQLPLTWHRLIVEVTTVTVATFHLKCARTVHCHTTLVARLILEFFSIQNYGLVPFPLETF